MPQFNIDTCASLNRGTSHSGVSLGGVISLNLQIPCVNAFHRFTAVPSLGIARMSLGSQTALNFSDPEIAGANVPARR